MENLACDRIKGFLKGVYQHHERIDGSGYPQSLSGKDILLEARIMAVADKASVQRVKVSSRLKKFLDKLIFNK